MASEELNSSLTLNIHALPSFLICCYPVTPRLPLFSLPSETSWPLSCTLSLLKSLPTFICQSPFSSSSFTVKNRACEPVKNSNIFLLLFYVFSKELICPFNCTQWSLKTFVLMLLFCIFYVIINTFSLLNYITSLTYFSFAWVKKLFCLHIKAKTSILINYCAIM